MTAICLAFLLVSDTSFGLPTITGQIAAVAAFLISGIPFALWRKKEMMKDKQ